MSDQPFNWNLLPKKPEDAAEPQPAQPAFPPQQPAAPQPPVAAPPPAWNPAAQQAPPPGSPPQAAPPVSPPQAAPPQWPAQQTTPPAAPPPAWNPAAPQAPPPVSPPQAAPPQWPAQQTTPPQQPAPQWPANPPTQGAPVFPTGSYGYPPTSAQPPVELPPVTPARSFDDVPTQALSYDPFATQAYPFDGSLSGATDVLGAQPVGLPELRDESPRQGQASAIDSLFGESQFKEYEAGALPVEGFSALASTRPRQPREPLGTTQKVLLWVAGGLVAALALVGLFIVGTKLPALFPEAPPAEQAAPSVAPVAAKPVVLGPIAAGEHAWGDLLGTECIDPYVSAWQEKYVVVDCSAPHAAQMVYHGYFGDEAWAPYPGLVELQSRINLLCTSTTSIDYSVASQFSDIQIAASYAATEQQWNAGQRDYFCFVSRSSGEPMTLSVANAVVPAEGLTATVPGNDP